MGGSVYAFAGGKGGVGKTTTTANVAVALASSGYEVVAVDADVGMTNLGEFLGVTAERGITHVLGGEGAVEDVLVGGPAGVRVVPGGDDLAMAGDADPSNLRKVVEPLRRAADIVLVDTGAGISHGNMVAYGLADAVTLVTTGNTLAATDAAKSAEIAGFVDSDVVGTVVTRVTPDTSLDDLAETFDGHVVAAVPEYAEPEAEEPRILMAPDSPAAAEYERLAATVAVCHESSDLEGAASAASKEVTLPDTRAATDGGETDDGVEPEGNVDAGVLDRIPFFG